MFPWIYIFLGSIVARNIYSYTSLEGWLQFGISLITLKSVDSVVFECESKNKYNFKVYHLFLVNILISVFHIFWFWSPDFSKTMLFLSAISPSVFSQHYEFHNFSKVMSIITKELVSHLFSYWKIIFLYWFLPALHNCMF